VCSFSNIILFFLCLSIQQKKSAMRCDWRSLKLAARRPGGETERRTESERISVVNSDVVHGVFAVVGVVVASKQTIDLGIDEQVVVQSSNPGFRHARWTRARGTAEGPLSPTARVRFKARHAESVATQQNFRTNPEAAVAQPTS